VANGQNYFPKKVQIEGKYLEVCDKNITFVVKISKMFNQSKEL